MALAKQSAGARLWLDGPVCARSASLFIPICHGRACIAAIHRRRVARRNVERSGLRRQQALDLLAAQRQQFDVIEADLESHLAELEQRLAAGLATADNRSAR